MAYTVSPAAGVDLTNTILATDITSGARTVPHLLGTEIFSSDGKIYVFGKANASISASTTACTVSASTFLVTASGGSYTSPATAMVTGDYGWFSKASV
jgi:hypothetical protein